jgi:hypothetical protein
MINYTHSSSSLQKVPEELCPAVDAGKFLAQNIVD